MSPAVAGECLRAVLRGDDSEDAEVGAALMGEFVLRVIHALTPEL